MKKKDEAIYTDFNSSMERIKAQNERYENASPEYKVLHGVLNNLNEAFYAIKYRSRAKEDILLELAQARGKVTALAIMELNKDKGKE